MDLETIQKAPSQETQCGSCKTPVRFYRFGGMSELYPHFYCDSCSNLFFSEAHHARVLNAPPDASLLESVAATLPACPCGGRFRPGENPKCPNCGVELKHQLDPVARLTDPFGVLLSNASLCRPRE